MGPFKSTGFRGRLCVFIFWIWNLGFEKFIHLLSSCFLLLKRGLIIIPTVYYCWWLNEIRHLKISGECLAHSISLINNYISPPPLLSLLLLHWKNCMYKEMHGMHVCLSPTYTGPVFLYKWRQHRDMISLPPPTKITKTKTQILLLLILDKQSHKDCIGYSHILVILLRLNLGS